MPTIKQKLAFKKITEDHRSVSGAMREVGYDVDTASKPSNLTESKGWKELVEQFMPESKVAQRHGEALDAMKWNDFTGEREADHDKRLKAVELNYKITGKLRDVGIQFNAGELNINNIIDNGEDKAKPLAEGGI